MSINFESGFTHAFPAVRGVQAGKAFYIAMCPLRLVPKIFMFDEVDVPPELRAQRILNKARVPDITRYLLNYSDSYVLSALTASVDGKVVFTPSAESGPMATLGTIKIPMESRILINDGQHRRAAIEEAIKKNQLLGHDNIPVIFFMDEGLSRSQQMFADLNNHAVRPSTSLGTLYDQRDPTARLATQLATLCKTFAGLTEMEKSSISNRAAKLFALASVKLATRALLRLSKHAEVSAHEEALADSFWEEVGVNIPDWLSARHGEVTAAKLREETIHAHSVALQALGTMGAQLLEEYPENWREKLQLLKTLDWCRSNTELWAGTIKNGRMSKSASSLAATAAVIKKHIGLQISPQENELLKNHVFKK